MFVLGAVWRLSYLMVCWALMLVVLFCFKQKTAYEMRISDWSSDVCSSDLPYGPAPMATDEPRAETGLAAPALIGLFDPLVAAGEAEAMLARAPDRTSVL